MRDRSVMKLVWKLMEWWYKLLTHMLIDHLHAYDIVSSHDESNE
jgi:hypothetical protein